MAPPDRVRRWFWLAPDDPLIPLLEGLDNARLVALLRAVLLPGGQAEVAARLAAVEARLATVEARLAAGEPVAAPAPALPAPAAAWRGVFAAFGEDEDP